MSTHPAFSRKRPDPMQIALSDFQDQLMRGLAHRMNNILSLFHGYLGLLMDDKKLDSVTKEGLSKIKDGAKAASDLMERTHALVRPTSAVWRDINLCDLLRQMRPTFESFCGPKVRIAIECDGDVHLLKDVHERDLPRQNDLVLNGWCILRFTPDRYWKRPQSIIAEVRAAVATQQRLLLAS